MLPRCQPDGGESCIIADCLIALLPTFQSVRLLLYVNFILQAKNTANKAMRGMSETLMLDVMVPEAHHNDHSYVHELCGLTFDSQCKNSAQWTLTRTMSKKNTKTIKNWRVGTCSGLGVCLGQYGNCVLLCSLFHCISGFTANMGVIVIF